MTGSWIPGCPPFGTSCSPGLHFLQVSPSSRPRSCTHLPSLYFLETSLSDISLFFPFHPRPKTKYILETLPQGTQIALNNATLKAPSQIGPTSRKNPFAATLVKNTRLTAPTHFQDVRHLELDITGSGITFDAGDIAVIQPQNLPRRVEAVIQHLQLATIADLPINISPNPEGVVSALPVGWPSLTTVRELLTNYLDIFGIPRRHFFELLSFFAQAEAERDKLREFVSAEGQQDLLNYCNKMRRTAYEALQDFPSLVIPLEYLCDLFPPLQPRSFSISSSLKAHPESLSLTVAIVNYRSKMSTARTGVCTSWLAQLQPGAQIPLWIEKGTMILPQDPTIPVIAIGPGTGCAPFRAFLQERASTGATRNTFFFGCRSKSGDYLYQQELETLEALGELKLLVAFSRDQVCSRLLFFSFSFFP